VILTDPVFTSCAGPFGRMGPRRVRDLGIAASALPAVDLVLVSHNHYDHLQPSSLRMFADRAVYIAPLGVGRQLGLPAEAGSYEIPREHVGRQPGLPAEAGSCEIPREHVASGFSRKIRDLALPAVEGSRTIHELDWWQSATAGAAEITCVPAQHFSARTPWDRDRTLWSGFVVRVDGVTIYFAGDTGYSPQFAAIAAACPPIDVALLPIGAYEPRWFMEPVHMNPEEAVRAHLDVGSRASVGMHFGTFQLTDEAIDEPLRALERARAGHGVKAEAFRVLDFGETVVL
jgi:L-ascorbate metabolism protein UlaG (beta-lactamase superfamily)